MRHTALLLALVVLGLYAPAALSQSLTGRVTDAETGAPLPGATVAVPALALGASTGADGRFVLSALPAGSARVVVSFVGYRSETRTVDVGAGGAGLDVALAPSVVEAPDVTVTARARASDVLSTPQSVAVVDEEALDRAGGATPFDALDEVAGVRLLRTGPGIAKPVIRGLTSQRVLVVQDGVRQEGQGWGDEHAPEVGAADVDRIEVVRGPASLLYGSDALGGVVQTVPTDLFARTAPLGGEASLAGATVAQQTEGTLVVGGVSGRLGYEVRGGALRAGLVRTPSGLVPNTALDTETLSGRVGTHVGEGGRLVAEAGTFRQSLGLFEDGGLVPEAPAGRFTIDMPRQTVAHDRAALRLDLPLGLDRLDVVAAVQQNRRREFEEHEDEDHLGDEHGDEEHGGGAAENLPTLSLRLTTVTTDARFHHRPLGPVFGVLGVSGMFQRNETLAEEVLIPGGTTLNGAVYAAEQVVSGPLTLDAGVRFDARHLDVEANGTLGVEAQTRTYTALTGAVGAAWQLRPDLSVAANLGRAFRAPILQELFGNGVHEGTLRFERGNAALAPETSLALDGVVRYLTPHVYAEVSGFVNAIGGYITPRATGGVDPESGFQVYDFVQSDARLVGAEARLDVHPHALHGLGVHLAGDVTRGTDTDADRPLPFVPPARLQTAVEYRAGRLGPARDVEARIGPTFVAAQRRADLPEEVPTDAYTVWSASASASFAVGGAVVTPTLAVDNLTDATFVDPLSRYRPFGVPAPGRSVRLALRASF
ncbi:TonB-dependent receptor [Rubrivirga sp. S365]|uniref:TonB-dependent receptor n=1 Tax=Rubrivirga litoralis TaxID=3075598 RepID=A0ABU3BPZ5_9BACT|nr:MULTISPECIES: TonB-dependent receptor [unclassified Rubrivirga]MDT0631366.1 TonB-dependent receptor [Rubrivirga sp. F394]MDT7855957.1 TonB-dependent receptor [Rubrivirga sp. S365]